MTHCALSQGEDLGAIGCTTRRPKLAELSAPNCL